MTEINRKLEKEGLVTGLKHQRQLRPFRNDRPRLLRTYLYAKVMHSKSFVSEASMEIWDMLAFPK